MTTYNIKINDRKETVKDTDVKEDLNDPQIAAAKKEEELEKQIVVDGPLSSIYTQALNIAYAKESAADGSVVGSFDSSIVVDDASLTDPDLYVYVTSSDEINREGANKSFDDLNVALDKYKDSKMMVVIESGKAATSSVAALEEYVVGRKIRTSYSRSIAVDKILSAIK